MDSKPTENPQADVPANHDSLNACSLCARSPHNTSHLLQITIACARERSRKQRKGDERVAQLLCKHGSKASKFHTPNENFQSQ